MIGPDLMDHSRRWSWRHKMRLTIARFVCDIFGHRGEIVGTGTPMPIEKRNKETRPFKGLYWRRRCNRYGCGESFTRLADRIQDL